MFSLNLNSTEVLTISIKDMGLGKSLSMLALICSSLDSDSLIIHQNQNERRQGTLIVAPKSSMFKIDRRDARVTDNT